MSLRTFIKPCCGAETLAFDNEPQRLNSCYCERPINWVTIFTTVQTVHSTNTFGSVPLLDSYQEHEKYHQLLTIEARREREMKELNAARIRR